MIRFPYDAIHSILAYCEPDEINNFCITCKNLDKHRLQSIQDFAYRLISTATTCFGHFHLKMDESSMEIKKLIRENVKESVANDQLFSELLLLLPPPKNENFKTKVEFSQKFLYYGFQVIKLASIIFNKTACSEKEAERNKLLAKKDAAECIYPRLHRRIVFAELDEGGLVSFFEKSLDEHHFILAKEILSIFKNSTKKANVEKIINRCLSLENDEKVKLILNNLSLDLIDKNLMINCFIRHPKQEKAISILISIHQRSRHQAIEFIQKCLEIDSYEDSILLLKQANFELIERSSFMECLLLHPEMDKATKALCSYSFQKSENTDEIWVHYATSFIGLWDCFNECIKEIADEEKRKDCLILAAHDAIDQRGLEDIGIVMDIMIQFNLEKCPSYHMLKAVTFWLEGKVEESRCILEDLPLPYRVKSASFIAKLILKAGKGDEAEKIIENIPKNAFVNSGLINYLIDYWLKLDNPDRAERWLPTYEVFPDKFKAYLTKIVIFRLEKAPTLEGKIEILKKNENECLLGEETLLAALLSFFAQESLDKLEEIYKIYQNNALCSFLKAVAIAFTKQGRWNQALEFNVKKLEESSFSNENKAILPLVYYKSIIPILFEKHEGEAAGEMLNAYKRMLDLKENEDTYPLIIELCRLGKLNEASALPKKNRTEVTFAMMACQIAYGCCGDSKSFREVGRFLILWGYFEKGIAEWKKFLLFSDSESKEFLLEKGLNDYVHHFVAHSQGKLVMNFIEEFQGVWKKLNCLRELEKCYENKQLEKGKLSIEEEGELQEVKRRLSKYSNMMMHRVKSSLHTT